MQFHESPGKSSTRLPNNDKCLDSLILEISCWLYITLAMLFNRKQLASLLGWSRGHYLRKGISLLVWARLFRYDWFAGFVDLHVRMDGWREGGEGWMYGCTYALSCTYTIYIYTHTCVCVYVDVCVCLPSVCLPSVCLPSVCLPSVCLCVYICACVCVFMSLPVFLYVVCMSVVRTYVYIHWNRRKKADDLFVW